MSAVLTRLIWLEHHDHSHSDRRQVDHGVAVGEIKEMAVENKLPTQFEDGIDKISLKLDNSSAEDTNSTEMKPTLHVDICSVGDAESRIGPDNNDNEPSFPVSPIRHQPLPFPYSFLLSDSG